MLSGRAIAARSETSDCDETWVTLILSVSLKVDWIMEPNLKLILVLKSNNKTQSNLKFL